MNTNEAERKVAESRNNLARRLRAVAVTVGDAIMRWQRDSDQRIVETMPDAPDGVVVYGEYRPCIGAGSVTYPASYGPTELLALAEQVTRWATATVARYDAEREQRVAVALATAAAYDAILPEPAPESDGEDE